VVGSLEAAVINWRESHAVAAHGKPAAPGVYVTCNGRESKIAALGLKVRKGCTYHGLAVNIAMDLTPFSDIDPCGYPGLAVTQLSDFAPVSSVERAGEEIAPIVVKALHRR